MKTAPGMEALIRLQSLHAEREDVAARLARLPLRRKQARDEFAAFEAELKDFSAEVETLRKQIRSIELDIEECRQQERRYQSQLLEVKTNDAYRALLHEIENVQAKVREMEDAILEKMVAEESVRSRAASRKADEPARRKTFDETSAALDAEEAKLMERAKELAAAWTGARAGVDAGLLSRFDRQLQARGGVAVAAIEDGGMCAACHIDVRPQLVQEVRAAKSILSCENCHRFLYWKDEEEVEAGASAS